MEKWVRDRLSNCLDFDIPDDMIKYIMRIKTSEEFDEYFDSLLNKECNEHRLFLADCKQRLFSKSMPNKKMHPNSVQSGNKKQYQKQLTVNNKQQKPHPQEQQTKPNKKPGYEQQKQNYDREKQDFEQRQQKQQHVQHNQQQGTKKKAKYVSLYATDGKIAGDTIMLKGRRWCDCQASEHKLINNCLSCGRIVCEQEGSGPCLFCGEVIGTNEEMQIVKSGGKKGDNLMKMLKEKGGGESLKKAMEQRDRLLEYDRNSEKRTTVIDDELDYFQENSVWLSDAEREKFERLKQEMHEKKHASRAQRKITVDFAGRPVNDDGPTITEEYERNVLKEISAVSAASSDNSNWANRKHGQQSSNTDPNLDAARPIYKITAEGKANARNMQVASDGLERIYNRVQDKELLEMQDMRQCLSMHQPWASLLVAGIKKHEGRVWYTEHRGRLWIASTVKEAKPEEIKQMEDFYKHYYNDPNIKFPEQYPNGCLLGCVKVDDCLPQEEYREQYPNGESESPYVLVCSNPEELPMVFPIKGQHKIYQIDPKVHNVACKTLLRLKTT